MSGVPLVEFGPDHRQVHGPLNDLVVMTSLREKAVTFKIILNHGHAAKFRLNSSQCNYLISLSAFKMHEINVT